MITKSQFCHGSSVPDVGDLVEVILASVIIYFFDFTVGSHFVALIGIELRKRYCLPVRVRILVSQVGK